MNRGRGRASGSYSAPGGRSQRSRGHSGTRPGPTGANGTSTGFPSRQWRAPMYNNPKQFEGKPIFNNSYQQDQHDHSSPSVEDVSSQTGKLQLGENLLEPDGLSSKQFEHLSASDSVFGKKFDSLSAESGLKGRNWNEKRACSGQTSESGSCGSGPKQFNVSPIINISHLQEGSSLLAKSSDKVAPSPEKMCGQNSLENAAGSVNMAHPEFSSAVEPFDICPGKVGNQVMLKPSLLTLNREKRKASKRSLEGPNGSVLRPGMVLLKNYISSVDQVKIVKKCRELGLGFGGFYQPGYQDGAKLQLKMMCLGKNWDPDKSEYGSERPFDGAKPPAIPYEFYQLVKDAIHDSHSVIEKDSKIQNVEDVLPWMTPDVCIVNFYTTSGRLGLHKDKDESRESLRKKLPVVSFSIGDSADFLYSDQRDADPPKEVVLESGDVLIFGGNSRDIFHGVSAIHSKSAPKFLLDETHLRSGRLNLTFRQY